MRGSFAAPLPPHKLAEVQWLVSESSSRSERFLTDSPSVCKAIVLVSIPAQTKARAIANSTSPARKPAPDGRLGKWTKYP
jgi:hypothetical protein